MTADGGRTTAVRQVPALRAEPLRSDEPRERTRSVSTEPGNWFARNCKAEHARCRAALRCCKTPHQAEGNTSTGSGGAGRLPVLVVDGVQDRQEGCQAKDVRHDRVIAFREEEHDTLNRQEPERQAEDLQLGRDWIALPNTSPSMSRDDLPLVFAGYGITSPGSHDDYAGLDVAGKIAVVVSGKPTGLDSLRFPFGTIDAGSFQAKYVSALQHQAAGILFLSSPFFNENWQPFAVQAKSLAVWSPETPQPEPPAPFVVASEDLSHRLVAAMGAPADVMDVALRGEAVRPFPTNLTASLTLNVVRADAEARNVVGYLPGTKTPQEYVAFGAHYDHHGVIDGNVYNGADDDGSGSMSVLDIAEAFARDRAAGLTTDRSLLFVWHTAEEKGLIGSDYFTTHPQQSILGNIQNAVAQINIDMVGRENPDSMYVVGAYRLSNEYGALVDSINQAIGSNGRPIFYLNTHFDRPDDPEQIYERSDHYNYARFGVPIAFFFDGMGADWRKNTATDDYHRPTDDVDKINFDKMARAEQLVYAIGRATANAPHRPRINPDVQLEPAEH